jgi:SAM-dependent methyltransferase
VGRFVVRRDHPHARAGAGTPEGLSAEFPRGDGVAVDERLARLVADGSRVLVFGREAAALARTLEEKGCRTVAVAVEGRRSSFDLDPGHWTSQAHRERFDDDEGADADGRFDAIVVADLLGRIDDPRGVLHGLKEQLRPGGTLIIALDGIAPIDGGRLAIVDGEPLGAGSGVHFSEEGLLGLLEAADYVIGHVERIEPVAGPAATAPAPAPVLLDCLIVAHPLPVPGLDFLQRRMRDLVQQGREAAHEVEELRRIAALAEQRLEVLSGQERRMSERIKELRARLLDAHAEMTRRDEEIWTTFGDAIFLRNALLIERDDLTVQRDALVVQRDALVVQRDALVAERSTLHEERGALYRSLHSAEIRLGLFRMSPLGLVYRAIRKLVPRRGGTGDPDR